VAEHSVQFDDSIRTVRRRKLSPRLSVSNSIRLQCAILALAVAGAVSGSNFLSADEPLPPAASKVVDFARDVQPILAKRCIECHGATKQRGGLRLDSAEGIRAGGATGEIVVAGKSAESPLIHHVGAVNNAARMPPKGDPLSPEQIGVLRAWIDQGAKAPVAAKTVIGTDEWALVPLKRPALPTVPVEYQKWVRNPVDAFILQKLLANGLSPSPAADHRTLIRRLSVDLTGLLPTPDEVAAFESDSAPNAYESLVDRLLASPHYGERWARHWLDVVHYADTHGHDEDGARPNAWPYRDYLIRWFNDDKPYARFVQEQIAGDVLFPDDPAAIVATGFLAAGPWDQSGLAGIREDSLDRVIAYYLDRDDIVTTTFSTFAGLTVGCARCHDHKFDPITQEDYYSLQAVFAGVNKTERTFDADPAVGHKRAQLQKSLAQARAWKGKVEPALLHADRQADAAAFETAWRAAENRWVVPEMLAVKSKGGAILKPLVDRSILSLGLRPDKDTYTITLGTDLVGMTGLRLEVLSDETLPHGGPGRADNGNLHLSEVRVTARAKGSTGPGITIKLKAAVADFDQSGWGIARAIDGDPATAWGIYPAVGQSHRAIFEFDRPAGFTEETELTVELDQLHGSGHVIGRFRLAVTTEKAPLNVGFPILPANLTDALAVSPSWRTDAQKAALADYAWEQRLERELAELPALSRVYCGLNRVKPDAPRMTPRVVHVLKRGEVTRPGAVAVAGAVAAVPGLPGRFQLADPNDEGQRRAALADWLGRPDNPLTWRVIANRAWHYNFGKGIVDTPNDFGKMGGAPSHPELLDWLAVEFRDGGGSLKKLNRLLVTSSTYRQAVRHDPTAATKDADNRMLWRMNRTRLDAETVRDSVLLLSGRLDDTMFGPPVQHFISKPGVHVTPEADYDAFDLDAPSARRRSVYRFIFRTRPDPLLEALDCPDASQSAPVRSTSVGALQALALWDNKFTLRHAEHLAALAAKASTAQAEQVEFVAQRLYGRAAMETEVAEWTAYAAHHGLANLCRVLINSSEFLFVD
jgi:mono/diheme cytochrome c family protein